MSARQQVSMGTAGVAARRGVLVAAMALAWAPSAGFGQSRPASLPMRNLLVEVRQAEASSLDASAAGVERGAVVIGSDGRVSGRATLGVEARSGSAGAQVSQQLTVLNGGRASLRMGTAQPVQWLQVALTPQGPAVVGLGSSFVDTGRGVLVQPRWPGGNAPVTVEVEVESSAPTREGGTAGTRSLTTLALPLGEWVTVAETGESGTRRESGTLSTRDVAAGRRLVVQMRVSAP